MTWLTPRGVTMADIDLAREEATVALERCRRFRSAGIISTADEERLAEARWRVERMLEQWWEQDCQEPAPRRGSGA